MSIQANRDADTVGKLNTVFVGTPAIVPAGNVTVINNTSDDSKQVIQVNFVKECMDFALKNVLSIESGGTVYVVGDADLGKSSIRAELVFASITALESGIGFAGNVRTQGDNFLLNLVQQTLDYMRENYRLAN